MNYNANSTHNVIPAKAGTHASCGFRPVSFHSHWLPSQKLDWIPACAGMTKEKEIRPPLIRTLQQKENRT